MKFVRLNLLRIKIAKNSLLKTGDAVLIEGNNWGDKIWGQVDGIGENYLRKILMKIREELKINE